MRDEFICWWCGARPRVPPLGYDGAEAVSVGHGSEGTEPFVLCVDHIVSRRNGGSHHPSNLQALCDPCNSAKVGLVDRFGPKRGR